MTSSNGGSPLSIDDAVARLRSDPKQAQLVMDAYLGRDVEDSARRFSASGEFEEVRSLLGAAIAGATVLDVGAGTGIASWAFLEAGASYVYALEPDPSDEVGRGAISRLDRARRIQLLDAYGEAIPLGDGSIDIVYARQLLHHAADLPRLVAECARVLKPGGAFLACREHVIDSPSSLRTFLASHPVHQLAGGENAYRLEQYMDAIARAGLTPVRVLGPTECVINAYPVVNARDELADFPRLALRRRLGLAGEILSHLPGIGSVVHRHANRAPGRMYTFYAIRGVGV